jgi:DNA polymerase III delta prime subunit
MYYLFEKYKPINLNDFVIDDKTKTLLEILINTHNLNILMIGDTGTGKTTLIDVIINEYYKDYDYKDCIMYINLLKEQGIHCFRQSIKTFCQTNNNSKFKKTIIIDNIDQINDQTQQIIRNNIDKYNHKINFLLSCSNIQKVLDNLQSRVNIIKLMNIKKEQLYEFAKNIINSENINIQEKSIDYLVNISNNSIRSLLSFLSKIILLDNKNISFDDIKKICTQISYSFFDEYTELWFNKKNYTEASEKIMQLTELGYSVMDVLETYFYYIKNISTIEDTYKFQIFPILCKYINIFHSVHEEPFELTIFTYELYNKIYN